MSTARRGDYSESQTPGYSRSWRLILALNVLFWLWFWSYYLLNSYPAESGAQIWEPTMPWAVAFGRGFGDGLSLVFATMGLPLKVALVVYFPCFVLTWPISQLPYPQHYFVGFDPQGFRLLAVTILSFFKWNVLLRAYLSLNRMMRVRNRDR